MALLVAATASAETFDAATFTPPAGWQRHPLQGAVAYGTVDRTHGSYALMTVFASVGTTGDPARDFEAAWRDLVAVPSNVAAPTQGPVRSTTTQGLPLIAGGAQTTLDGVTSGTVVAVVVSGDRVVRVQAASNSPQLLAAIEPVLTGIVIGTAQPAAAPAQDLDDYQIAIPSGWTTSHAQGAFVMTSPTGECTLAALPERSARGSLDDEAAAAFAQSFAGWDHRNSAGPFERITKGTSIDGWDYIRLDSFLWRQTSEMLGVVFAVRLDGVTALFVGTRAKSTVTSSAIDVIGYTPRCLDDFTPSEWPAFVRDLHFKRWKARPSDFHDKLVGTWQSSYGGVTVQYDFAANGHYTAIVGYQTARRVDNATIETSFHALPGRGRYELSGDTLTLIPDGHAREVKKVRWYMEWDLGSWKPTLRLQDRGTPGEMLLHPSSS